MALNGWHRLLIVLVAAWALAVSGLGALEYRAGQGQVGDGLFTCWEPSRPPTPPVARYWNRECGIFPRVWVSTGLFDDLPPHARYLNTTRFLAILLGPPAFVGLSIIAVCWIMTGFGWDTSKKVQAELNAGSKMASRHQSMDPSYSHTQAWLGRMPRRWARNAAIGGGAPALLSSVPLLASSNVSVVAFMCLGLVLVTLGSAGVGYLGGVWARSSLMAPFALSPASALARITPNWLTGAILLAALLLASDVLFGWRKTTLLFETGISFRDLGYLTGFFGSWMCGGYLTALVSKRGLRKAIEADRRAASRRITPVPVSDVASLQREYSVG